jgi:lysophospholipase L1-like esterase
MQILESIMNKWKLNPQKPIRVVAFGSSNTELHWHSLGHFNWFSWLSSALREWVGRHVTLINQGINGETSKDLLKRIDRDVLSFNPDLVIITIGGNDTWKELTIQEYQDYLTQIVEKIRDIKALPVLQTYYCLSTFSSNCGS